MEPNPLLREETVCLHLFAKDTWAGPDANFVQLHHADLGVSVGCTKKYKGLFSLHDDTRSMVDQILFPYGPKWKIHIMRIVAHGNSGYLAFNGMTRATTMSPEWRRLRSYFAPTARLELHGCGVASQTPILKRGTPVGSPVQAAIVDGTFSGAPDGVGLTYLRAVAATFGVPVTAGIDVQYVEANVWTFERDTVTVFPNGTFHYDNPEGRGMNKAEIERAARYELVNIKLELLPAGLYTAAGDRLRSLIRAYPGTPSAHEAQILINTVTNPGALRPK
jgi:hypothetical protein